MALQALDSQISREMQRSPAEVELQGVQKWEPYQKRIELVTAMILQALSDEEIGLDGILVLSQAVTKALAFISDDLGPDGLGKMRSAYAESAFDAIETDCAKALRILRSETDLM